MTMARCCPRDFLPRSCLGPPSRRKVAKGRVRKTSRAKVRRCEGKATARENFPRVESVRDPRGSVINNNQRAFVTGHARNAINAAVANSRINTTTTFDLPFALLFTPSSSTSGEIFAYLSPPFTSARFSGTMFQWQVRVITADYRNRISAAS